jgi:hypothetical protein
VRSDAAHVLVKYKKSTENTRKTPSRRLDVVFAMGLIPIRLLSCAVTAYVAEKNINT